MAADLFKCDAAFRELVRRAGEHTGCNLEPICLRGPERRLTRTNILQPLLTCVSLGYLRRLMEKGIQADRVLGHSLGEIAALAAAEIVSFETAVDIAAKRGELMDAAAAGAPGGMTAIITPAREAILERLTQYANSSQVVLANDNTPGQLVVSGEVAALEQLADWIAANKLGQCRRLAVAGPWHSPLMEPARREFSLWLDAVPFHPPRVPMIFNVTGETESRPERIRQLIARNLVEPVQWRSALARLRAEEPTALFEVGPGRVLSGLARANGFGDATRIFNINNLRGIEIACRVE
jgi:[acyl-carrier-protein] S-malonyltransferase